MHHQLLEAWRRSGPLQAFFSLKNSTSISPIFSLPPPSYHHPSTPPQFNPQTVPYASPKATMATATAASPPITTPTSTTKALDAAISRLEQTPADPHALASAARTLTRLADEAELTALETSDYASQTALLRRVQAAKVAAHTARKSARQQALKTSRTTLLPSTTPEVSKSVSQLTQDINDTLRRTTHAVADEVSRSRAAGDVVQDSTNILTKTKYQHDVLGSGIGSGKRTLQKLKRSETAANFVVLISFAFFFAVAGYVASQKLRSSFVASGVFRPAASAVKLPFAAVFRTAKWGMNVGRRRTAQVEESSGLINASLGNEDGNRLKSSKKSNDLDNNGSVSEKDESSDSNSTASHSSEDSHEDSDQGTKYSDSDTKDDKDSTRQDDVPPPIESATGSKPRDSNPVDTSKEEL